VSYPPEGSLLNPRYPAPVNMYVRPSQMTTSVVVRALARAVPGRVPAPASGAGGSLSSAGINPRTGRWYSQYEIFNGGCGARPDHDGPSAMDDLVVNVMNGPVEALETEFPVRVEAYELVPDSAGAGTFRGGCGIRRDLRFLADEGKLTNLSERQRFAPYGLFGGRPGALARTVINPGADEQLVHGKASREFAYGDVISFQQSGAGGYGDPLERDPQAVLEDVLDDYVSIDAARERYGVVIVGTGADLAIDHAATARCRGRR
jgi:N-methylhydantoinase B